MYEHPMKRAGISMSRILYSNTRMVSQGFPATRDAKMDKYSLGFKYRTYAAGKVTSTKSKWPYLLSILTNLVLVVFSNNDMDEAFPPKFSQLWAHIEDAPHFNDFTWSLSLSAYKHLHAANKSKTELQTIIRK